MNASGHTVLITGGSSGIGLALAEALLARGHEVLVCARGKRRLEKLRTTHPKIRTVVCDVSKAGDRESLLRWALQTCPELDVLINNAGIQRELALTTTAGADIEGIEREISTNLTAAVHLSALFAPHFIRRAGPTAIVNVSSGLGFIPLDVTPVYCATKAALHSFSVSLRSQLSETQVRVFELIPPLVNSELHRSEFAREQSVRGIEPEVVAGRFLRAFEADRLEVPVGQARDLMIGSRVAPKLVQRLLRRIVPRDYREKLLGQGPPPEGAARDTHVLPPR